MRIVALNGSPRGEESQTLQLMLAILEGAQQAGADTEWFDVCKLNIHYCISCDVCHRTGACVHEDDFERLRDKMMEAEAIVFSSPNYFRSVTAQMKTAIDRMADVIHCQLFRGKYACSASVAGGPQCTQVTDYLNEILLGFGAYVVGSVGASMCEGPPAMAAAKNRAVQLGADLVAAVKDARAYPDQQRRHDEIGGYFKKLVEMNSERWPHEHELWAHA